MRVLVVNAGSSSLKLRVLGPGDEVLAAEDLGAGASPEAWLRDVGEVDVVVHRVVHGGDRFRAAVRIDGEVRAALEELSALAPLHQPPALAGIDAVAQALPGVPAVAAFDTAFHATIPPAAATYAVPAEWRERFGVRRYGFHGLSHQWAARRADELTAGGAQRLVTCHLGAGASVTAVLGGRSVDTSMGFTPLEGVVMATRSGSIDPGLVLWLQERVDDVGEALTRRSGLVGLAGTADMREVLARDDDEARLALDVYVHRLRTTIAGMTAALGGLDAVVFTGGIGERSAAVRARACAGLAHLGVALDEARNAAAGDEDAEVGADGGAVRVLVVHAREDLELARQARAVLAAS